MLMFITGVSLAVALAMTLVTWRLLRREKRRSKARIAALAAELQRDPLADLAIFRPESVASRPGSPSPGGGPMFAAAPAGRSHLAAVIAAGMFVVGSAAALAVVLGGSASSSGVSGQPATPVASQATADPIELVALGHERDGDALGVHGTIRNPRTGPALDGLNVVVFLFRRDGSFATSTRAPVVPPTLASGGEASFRVTVPNAGDVARYRVSFRTDQRVVAHVDRRGATEEVSR